MYLIKGGQQDISEFLGSLAQGQACEKTPALQTVPCQIRRDLKKDGTLEFKTDNRVLFDFALEELEPAGWKADTVTFDLHADEALVRGNIMTEYEERFSAAGNPICKYVIRR